MKILVAGAGAWGSALAISAARHVAGHVVLLAARDPDQLATMRARRENTRYLPGHVLPDSIELHDFNAQPWRTGGLDLIVVGTPMAALRSMIVQLAQPDVPLAWLCKGFEASTSKAQGGGLLGHEVLEEVAPQQPAGVLSGPSFAQEVAAGQPTALVAASADAAVRAHVNALQPMLLAMMDRVEDAADRSCRCVRRQPDRRWRRRGRGRPAPPGCPPPAPPAATQRPARAPTRWPTTPSRR